MDMQQSDASWAVHKFTNAEYYKMYEACKDFHLTLRALSHINKDSKSVNSIYKDAMEINTKIFHLIQEINVKLNPINQQGFKEEYT